jgi:hypothetical protein
VESSHRADVSEYVGAAEAVLDLLALFDIVVVFCYKVIMSDILVDLVAWLVTVSCCLQVLSDM